MQTLKNIKTDQLLPSVFIFYIHVKKKINFLCSYMINRKNNC